MTKKLIYVPDPLLRQKASKVSFVGKEEKKIAKEMKEVMLKAPGVGLAANQIGILKQIVTIFFIDQNTNKKFEYNLFNPKILSYSNKTVVMEEGCLSMPEQFAEIERPDGIFIEYIDDNNKKITKDVKGTEARILQHEIDHLSGKLFIDYLSSLKRKFMIKKVEKYLRKNKI